MDRWAHIVKPGYSQMDIKGIINQTIEGLESAQETANRWSPFVTLMEIPEYLANVAIARNLVKNMDVFVTLEDHVWEVIQDAGGKLKRTGSVHLPESGRFDIVVWDNASPTVLIEIKRGSWGPSLLRKESTRLCSALNEATSIKHGLLAYFMLLEDGKVKSARSRIYDRTKSIAQSVARHIDRSSTRWKIRRHSGDIQVYENYAWRAEVLELYRNRRRS